MFTADGRLALKSYSRYPNLPVHHGNLPVHHTTKEVIACKYADADKCFFFPASSKRRLPFAVEDIYFGISILNLTHLYKVSKKTDLSFFMKDPMDTKSQSAKKS